MLVLKESNEQYESKMVISELVFVNNRIALNDHMFLEIVKLRTLAVSMFLDLKKLCLTSQEAIGTNLKKANSEKILAHHQILLQVHLKYSRETTGQLA